MEFYKQKGYTQQKDNNWAKIGCSNVVVSSSDWNEHQVYNLLHFVFCSFADISYTLLYCSYMLYTVIHCTFAGICYTLYFCRHLLYTVIHCTFAGICYTPLYTVLLQASVIHRYTLYFFRHLLYTITIGERATFQPTQNVWHARRHAGHQSVWQAWDVNGVDLR